MIADAMVTRFERLTPGSTVQDAAECLIRTIQHEFPVVDNDGRLMGVLTRDELVKALRDQSPGAPVVGVMRKNIATIDQRRGLDEALRLMQERNLPLVGAVDASGRLTGLVTRENVGELMMLQTATPKQGGGGGTEVRWRPRRV